MNLVKSSLLLLVFVCSLLAREVVANTEDGVTPDDSSVLEPTTNSDPSNTVTDSPVQNASMTTTPPPSDACIDDPNWLFEHDYIVGWSRATEIRRCEDDGIECCHKGNLGYARDFCCKCKPGNFECTQDPDDDGFPIALQALTCVGFVFSTLLIFKMFRERELYQIRQTMAARRQQQRENNEQGLTEEERNNARYELFAKRFHFQEVFPDKSNISVDGLRRSSIKLGGDGVINDDEEAKTDIVDAEDSSVIEENSRQSAIDLRKLSGFWKSAAKDECCVCLESYIVGETICAPKTTECDHVFHEGCIHEWIMRGNDRCPLCRIDWGLKE